MTSSASAATCLPSEACFSCALDAQGMVWCVVEWCHGAGFAVCAACAQHFRCPFCAHPANDFILDDANTPSLQQDGASFPEECLALSNWDASFHDAWFLQDRLSMLEERLATVELTLYRQSGNPDTCLQRGNAIPTFGSSVCHELLPILLHASNGETLAVQLLNVMQRYQMVRCVGWTADGRPVWTLSPQWQ